MKTSEEVDSPFTRDKEARLYGVRTLPATSYQKKIRTIRQGELHCY